MPPFLAHPDYWYSKAHNSKHFDQQKLEDLSDSEVQNKDTSKHLAEVRTEHTIFSLDSLIVSFVFISFRGNWMWLMRLLTM
jgi:hypothetical protein